MAVNQPVEPRPVSDSGAGVRSLGDSVPLALIVAGSVLLSIVVHYLLALEQTAPWLMGDELRYAEMAKSFFDEGELLFREELTTFATAYPVLIAPAWAAADVETAYEIAKAINVLLMTSSAVVVFLWMRRLVPTVYALAAGGLVLLMPTFTYTGMLMTENAAIPAFLLAAFVIARALERPTLGWQLAVFALIALAALLRIQVVTLALVYPTAIALDAVFARRGGVRSLRASLARFVPTFAILAIGSAGYVIFTLLSGAPLSSGLGAYDAVGEVGYDKVDVARWSVWHAGELVLSVGVLPAIAFSVLLVAALQRGSLPTAGERAYVAVAATATFWFVLQAAAFASRFSGRIEERYMVYAAPLVLMALLVWGARGRERMQLSTFTAAVVPALLALTVPFERLFNGGLFGDTFGLIPFMRLSTVLDAGIEDVRIVVAGGLAVAVVAFVALSPRISRVLLPAAVAVFLVLSGYVVHGTIEEQSRAARGAQGVSDVNWVDDAVGRKARVGFIYGPMESANPHLLWQSEFWNRSVGDVYVLATDGTSSYTRAELEVNAMGRLRSKSTSASQDSIDEPYVLAHPSLGIVGEVVAQPGPLALIRVDPPARLTSAFDGVYADRWSGPNAGLSQYSPLGGGVRRLRVEVSRVGWSGPDVPGRVTITAGPLRMTEAGPTIARVTASRQWTVHSGLTRTFVLPVPPAPFRVEVRVTPTFSPAQFGQADTRQLGAQLAFAPDQG